MNNRITVKNVIERHDCAGRKFIDVTSLEEDELVASRFRLTRAYMLPHEKLQLGTVAPMDNVVIVHDEQGPMVLGEYVENLSDIGNRDPICRCGSPLISDGFDIYCPNDQCGLTLLTRMERLGRTTFFSHDDSPSLRDDRDSFIFTDDLSYTQPFLPILDPRLWGETIATLEDTLLTRRRVCVSMATFLVEPLFRDFLDSVNPMVNLDNGRLRSIATFYGCMEEMVNRRNYESPIHNRLIKEFIWALGIESLSEDVIDALVLYETKTGWMEDVMVPYAFLLSHPNELSREIGVHPLEARTIALEFYRRRHEMADIFVHYSTPDVMADIFRDLP